MNEKDNKWIEDWDYNGKKYQLRKIKNREYLKMLKVCSVNTSGRNEIDWILQNEYYLIECVLDAPCNGFKDMKKEEKLKWFDEIDRTEFIALIEKLRDVNEGTIIKKK